MQSCAVIGCGAAGMIASSLLRQHGLLVTCFEMNGDTGGMWNGNSHDNFTECGANIPLYPSMKCVIPKDLMSFSDFRFDATTPQFAHHTAVKHYLARYSVYKGVKALTRFHTKVQSVRWDSRDNTWKLITINLHNGDVMEWTFEKVCVCTGHSHSPRYPPQIRTILRSYVDHRHGELTHACYYKHWRECKGKRVVVIGDGVTAWEYCQGLRALGVEVIQSSTLSVLPTLTHNSEATLHSFSSSLEWEEKEKQESEPKNNSSSYTASNTTEKPVIKKKSGIASVLSYAWSNMIRSSSSWRLIIELMGWHRDVRHGVSVVQRWLSHRYTDMSFIPQVGYPVMCDERGILFGPLPQFKPLPLSSQEVHTSKKNMAKHHEAVEHTDSSFGTSIKSVLNNNNNNNDDSSNEFISEELHDKDNGTFVDNVDLVICATGFCGEYPFLHDEIRRVIEEDKQQPLLTTSAHTVNESKRNIESKNNWNSTNNDKPDHTQQTSFNTRGLYLGTLWKDNPSLAFVGIQRELLPPFLLFEAQARFVASAFTGRITIPSDANAMHAHEAMLRAQYPSLSHLYNANGVGLHSAMYFDVLQSQRSSKVSSSTVNATFTAHILKRQWWLFSSTFLRLYHAIRSLAPLKRKQQHLLFSNKI